MERRLIWRGIFCALSLSLAVGLAVPAVALFRWDDGVTDAGALPTAENLSLVTQRDVAISAELSGVDPAGNTSHPAVVSVTIQNKNLSKRQEILDFCVEIW